MKKEYSRREFIKKNTITGLGAACTMGLAPSLIAGSLSPERSHSARRNDTLYFDAFTRIGPRSHKHPEARWSLEHLLEEMDHCSISGALVSYTLSVMYDPMHSNLELSDKISSYPYLFGIWNVMPHHTDEFPTPEELGRRMREHDVRAVTIHPQSNGWDWRADHSGELLEWLNRNEILTILTSDEVGGWTGLDEFLEQYTSIPVLVISSGWIEQRYVLPLVEKHPHLHISFDRLQINKGIESLHKKGHSDQLIFATDTPSMSAGAHRTYIDYAAIPDDARAMVAGGNLTRLLGGQKPPSNRVNRDEDELMAAIRAGRPVPANLLDMHMHILDEGLHGAGGAGYRMEDGGPEGVFNLVNRLDYQGGGIMSWNGVVSSDAPAGNRTVASALDAAPRGYWGLASFDPTHYSQEELRSMIPRVYEDRRFIGMKPYHMYGVEYHDPSYDIWWEYGNEHQLYALIHHSRSDFIEVETLAGRYPNVRWVIAHAGGDFNWADHAIRIMQQHSNVYAEVTLTPVNLGIIEYLVEGAGEDRIMYGSDLPMRDPRQQLGWVVFSRLPVDVKRKMLAENAMRVIGPKLDSLPEYNRPVLS
ncbi:MAG: amidohydrolase family protein [Balneolaceae bacterium]